MPYIYCGVTGFPVCDYEPDLHQQFIDATQMTPAADVAAPEQAAVVMAEPGPEPG